MLFSMLCLCLCYVGHCTAYSNANNILHSAFQPFQTFFNTNRRNSTPNHRNNLNRRICADKPDGSTQRLQDAPTRTDCEGPFITVCSFISLLIFIVNFGNSSPETERRWTLYFFKLLQHFLWCFCYAWDVIRSGKKEGYCTVCEWEVV